MFTTGRFGIGKAVIVLACLLLGFRPAVGAAPKHHDSRPRVPAVHGAARADRKLTRAQFDGMYPEDERCNTFWPDLPQEATRPPLAGESLLLGPHNQLLLAADKAASAQFAYALRLSSRARQTISSSGDERIYSSAAVDAERYPQGMYIAFRGGLPDELSETPQLSQTDPDAGGDIVVFKVEADGSAKVVSSMFGGLHLGKVSLIDANRDGLLDLFVQGEASTGPADALWLYSVGLDGVLQRADVDWPEKPGQGEIASEWAGSITTGGGFAVVDSEGDGRWEVVVNRLLDYPNGIEACQYAHLVVLSFELQANWWANRTSRYPELIRQQRAFYAAYLEAARKYEELGTSLIVRYPDEDWSWQPERRLLNWRHQPYMVGQFDASAVADLLESWAG